MQIKIGWFGDSQLDYAQYGLLRRRDDFIEAVRSSLQDMHARSIRYVICTGDFLQSNRPSPYTMQALQEMQHWLSQKEMVVYVISGNHDNAKPHWIDIINAGDRKWGFQLLDHCTENADGISIAGIPNMSREAFLQQTFVPADILVMHQAVTQFIDFPMTNGIDVIELPFDKFSVIAIGDIHIFRIEPIRQLLPEKVNFKCIVGYSGATELNSESEPDTKYWVELVFDTNAERATVLESWTQHEIKTRPILRLQLDKVEDLDALIDSTKTRVGELVHMGDPREPIIFVRYNSTIPGVIERFRQNFDPDKFILRFHPLFHVARPVDAEIGLPVVTDISITDLLKAEVPESTALYGLASQLFNPDMESEHINASVDSYIEERLKPT